MHITRPLAAALLTAASVYLLAGEPAKLVTAPAVGPSGSGVLQVFLSLLLVIAAIIGTAWLMRRFTPGGQAGGQAQLRMVSGIMVGAKERVVVVEVRDTWLVLGVTAAGIATLHTLPRPDEPPTTPAGAMPFAERLAGVLKARKPAMAEQDSA